jgi:molybdate transport system permease protein
MDRRIHPIASTRSVFDLSPQELSAVGLSLKVATVATLATLPIAILVGYLLTRDFPGHAALNALVHLPLVLPPVVTGYALLLLFGRHGPVGAFLEHQLGVVFAFRWTGAALAAAVMSFPLAVRPIRLSFEAIDSRLPLAARSLGASRIFAFLFVSLPLALPGVVTGAILGFAKALGEFGATVTFVGNTQGQTQTIAGAIYVLIQTPGGDASALRLAVISAAIAIVALVVSEALQRGVRRRA